MTVQRKDLPIVILAAGASSRMRGEDKLMRPVDGQPLVATIAARAIASGAPVFLCLPATDKARHRAVEALDLTIVDVETPQMGLSASLAAGLAAIGGDAPGALLLLADMPEITTSDIEMFINHFRADPHLITRGADPSGKPGHPVVVPADLLPELARVSGDTGAQAVLKQHKDRLKLIPFDDGRALADLDTPEDWEKWEKGRRG